MHVSPLGHVKQVVPATPHSKLLVPLKQLLPMQQPLQLFGPHWANVWQTLPLQSAPGKQPIHCSPPKPQAPLSPPGKQVSPAQHPLQFEGPQRVVWQKPFMHCCPGPQSWQRPPPKPHANGSIPFMHASP
jgi:hypothetical protein